MSGTYNSYYNRPYSSSNTTPFVYTNDYVYSSGSCSGANVNCYSYSTNNTNTPTRTGIRSDAFAPVDLGNHGLVGALGLELGANYQIGNVVMGLTTDFSWFTSQNAKSFNSTGSFNSTSTVDGLTYANHPDSDYNWLQGSATQTNVGQSSYSGSVQIAPQWPNTFRLTAGVATDHLLTFASGGLAKGSVQTKINSAYSDSVSSTCTVNGGGHYDIYGYISGTVAPGCGYNMGPPPYYSTAESQTSSATWNYNKTNIRLGYVVGGGFAYALTDNALLKLESYYYDLGKQRVTVNGKGTTSYNGGSAVDVNVAPYQVETSLHGVMGRIGIDFKY